MLPSNANGGRSGRRPSGADDAESALQKSPAVGAGGTTGTTAPGGGEAARASLLSSSSSTTKAGGSKEGGGGPKGKPVAAATATTPAKGRAAASPPPTPPRTEVWEKLPPAPLTRAVVEAAQRGNVPVIEQYLQHAGDPQACISAHRLGLALLHLPCGCAYFREGTTRGRVPSDSSSSTGTAPDTSAAAAPAAEEDTASQASSEQAGSTASAPAAAGAGAPKGGPARRLPKRAKPLSLHGHVRVTGLLLAAGADPNVRTLRGGFTPLMGAVAHGDIRCCQLLLSVGARPDMVADDGRCAIDFAAGVKPRATQVRIIEVLGKPPPRLPRAPTLVQARLIPAAEGAPLTEREIDVKWCVPTPLPPVAPAHRRSSSGSSVGGAAAPQPNNPGVQPEADAASGSGSEAAALPLPAGAPHLRAQRSSNGSRTKGSHSYSAAPGAAASNTPQVLRYVVRVRCDGEVVRKILYRTREDQKMREQSKAGRPDQRLHRRRRLAERSLSDATDDSIGAVNEPVKVEALPGTTGTMTSAKGDEGGGEGLADSGSPGTPTAQDDGKAADKRGAPKDKEKDGKEQQSPPPPPPQQDQQQQQQQQQQQDDDEEEGVEQEEEAQPPLPGTAKEEEPDTATTVAETPEQTRSKPNTPSTATEENRPSITLESTTENPEAPSAEDDCKASAMQDTDVAENAATQDEEGVDVTEDVAESSAQQNEDAKQTQDADRPDKVKRTPSKRRTRRGSGSSTKSSSSKSGKSGKRRKSIRSERSGGDGNEAQDGADGEGKDDGKKRRSKDKKGKKRKSRRRPSATSETSRQSEETAEGERLSLSETRSPGIDDDDDADDEFGASPMSPASPDNTEALRTAASPTNEPKATKAAAKQEAVEVTLKSGTTPTLASSAPDDSVQHPDRQNSHAEPDAKASPSANNSEAKPQATGSVAAPSAAETSVAKPADTAGTPKAVEKPTSTTANQSSTVSSTSATTTETTTTTAATTATTAKTATPKKSGAVPARSGVKAAPQTRPERSSSHGSAHSTSTTGSHRSRRSRRDTADTVHGTWTMTDVKNVLSDSLGLPPASSASMVLTRIPHNATYTVTVSCIARLPDGEVRESPQSVASLPVEVPPAPAPTWTQSIVSIMGAAMSAATNPAPASPETTRTTQAASAQRARRRSSGGASATQRRQSRPRPKEETLTPTSTVVSIFNSVAFLGVQGEGTYSDDEFATDDDAGASSVDGTPRSDGKRKQPNVAANGSGTPSGLSWLGGQQNPQPQSNRPDQPSQPTSAAVAGAAQQDGKNPGDKQQQQQQQQQCPVS